MNEALHEFSNPEYLAGLMEAKRDFDTGGGTSLKEVLGKLRP